MESARPGETLTVVQSGIPTGQVVGVQVIKAATGAVALARTTVGVVNLPSGSGIYAATFVAPVEADLYIVILDWNGGNLTVSSKTVAVELQVTSSAAEADSGLGEIADHVKANLGGESFKMIAESPNYGASFISLQIDAVKHRIMKYPPATVAENTLPAVVLSYLGKIAALTLMPAVYDVWQNEAQSKAIGNDPSETVTYPSRQQMLKDMTEMLRAAIAAERPLAVELMPDPVLPSSTNEPDIDVAASSHVTRNPSLFPRQADYPGDPWACPDPLEVYGP